MISYYTRVLGEASNTALTKFRESPLAYYDWVTGEDDQPTTAMSDGSMFHMALLEPERFARTYVAIPDIALNSNDGKERFFCAITNILGVEWPSAGLRSAKAETLRNDARTCLEIVGKRVVEQSDLDLMSRMIDSLNKPCHRQQRNIVARGVKEHVLRWTDEDTGLQCKAKLDSWDEQLGIEADIKRTTRITHRQFGYACADHDYHYQRAFYRRGLRANGLEPRYQCFVAAYPLRPYYWATYDIDPGRLDECDLRITENLRDLADCLAKDTWPTINNGEPRTLYIRSENT